MATTTISALTAGTALAGTEVAPFDQGASTVKITATQIKTFTSASPTLVTPALGTPTSGTLTSCTGLPAAGVVGTAAILGANTFTGSQQLASGTTLNWNGDTILSRNAAATLQLGDADAASPVAQKLLAQSVVAGTTNTAGADLVIGGSKGTGTGAGGKIIFQVAPAGSSGSSQNALGSGSTNAPLQIDSQRNVYVYQNLYFSTTGVTSGTSLSSGGGSLRVLSNGAWSNTLTSLHYATLSTGLVKWSSGSNPETGIDAAIGRNTTNTLEVNTGTLGTYGDLVVRNSNANHLIGIGTAPTVTGNGSSNGSITGKDSFCKVTVGTGTTTSIVITFGTEYANAPVCVVNAQTTTTPINVVTTTTTATLTCAAFTAGEVLCVVTGGF